MTFDSFFDMLGDFDWLGIFVGTIALMIFGTIWFTAIFGKMYADALNEPQQASPEPMQLGMHAVAMLLYNIGLAYFLAEGLEHAVVAGGLIIGLLLVSVMRFTDVIWTKYPMRAFVIDSGYVIIGTALAMWVQNLFI